MENQENAETKKTIKIFTVKRAIRIISLALIVLCMCPTFLVSCTGKTMSIGVMDLVEGIQTREFSFLGESTTTTISDPMPFLLVCVFIPLVTIILLFIPKLKIKISMVIVAIINMADLIIWIIMKNKVSEKCAENNCTFETTEAYTIIICCLITVLLLTAFKLVQAFSPGIMKQNRDPVSVPAVPVPDPDEIIIGYCQKCGSPLTSDSKFCTGCGEPIPEQLLAAAEEAKPKVRYCIKCGTQLDADSSFCTMCGQKINY